MEQQMQAASLQLDKLQNTLQDTHLQISQIKGLLGGNLFILCPVKYNNFCLGFSARMTVLQEHQHQIVEALVAYDEALETGDPSRLGDNVLRPIASVASDSDILLSPNSDRNKVNGGTSHFNVIELWFSFVQ
jgi:hypothetical protein